MRRDRIEARGRDRMNATKSKRRRNPKGEGEHLKTELMDAAMRILDSSPAAPLSLRMVAREAGIAAPSIYPHFSDVRVLMSAIVRECWRQVGETMSAGTKSTSAGDTSGQLKAVMSGFVRYAMERPSRYQLLFAMQPIEPEPSSGMEGYIRPAYVQIHRAVKAYVASGGRFSAKDTDSATLLILSLAHGRIALAHLAPERPGNSSAAVEKFVLDQIDRVFPPAMPG